MTGEELRKMANKAQAAYDAMTPSQKLRHDYMQRRSFARGMGASATPHDVHCANVDKIMPDAALLTDAEIGLASIGRLSQTS